MSSRLKRTGALALIVFFMMITAVCAPVAFFLGKWRSEFDSAQAANLPSQFGADQPADYAALIAAQRLSRDCGGRGDPTFERIGVWDIPCQPYREVSGAGVREAQLPPARHAGVAGAPHTSSRRNGPLENATVRAIAETVLGSGAGVGTASPGDPLSLALAPGLPGLLGAGGLAGGPNAPGGLPGNIIPNIPGGGGPPVEPPPVATVPVPAALPLLLTGLGGLMVAARRRRKG